jgi:2-haloacid dehalogenase
MLDFSRFRVITFDCYGTLIDWETGILAAILPILNAHEAAISGPDILKIYGELEADIEASEYRPYREVLRELVRGFGTRLGFSPTPAEQDALPNSLATWMPFPDTVPALRKLKEKFKLGIISNVDDDLFAATAPKLEVAFDFVVTAAQAKAYKPSHKPFQLAESRMSVPKAQWLHAAQSVFHDVIPARAFGIASVWVNRPSLLPVAESAKQASATPDLEVPNLDQLAKIATQF